MVSGTEYTMFDAVLLSIFSENQQLTKLDIIRQMREMLHGQDYDKWHLVNYVNEKARDGTLTKIEPAEGKLPKYIL
jgi:hypothetical protein